MRKFWSFLIQIAAITIALGVCDHFSSAWSIDFFKAKCFFFFGGAMGMVVNFIGEATNA